MRLKHAGEQVGTIFFSHGAADGVKHSQGGPVVEAECGCQPAGGIGLSGSDDEKGEKPVMEGQAGAVHHGSGCKRCLRSADGTFVEVAGFDIIVGCVVAVGTLEAFGPASGEQKFAAGFFVGKAVLKFF